jgi:hypothetical protein
MTARLNVLSVGLMLASSSPVAAQVVRVLPETLEARAGRDGKWLILTVRLEQIGAKGIRYVSLTLPPQIRLRYFDSPAAGCGLDGSGRASATGGGTLVWSRADSGGVAASLLPTDTCGVGRFAGEVAQDLPGVLVFPAVVVSENGDTAFLDDAAAPSVVTHPAEASPVLRGLLGLLLAACVLITGWLLRSGRVRR